MDWLKNNYEKNNKIHNINKYDINNNKINSYNRELSAAKDRYHVFHAKGYLSYLFTVG